MECRNAFCIYYKNGNCICEKISLDEIGMCIECIHVSVCDNLLEKLKEQMFKKYESDI